MNFPFTLSEYRSGRIEWGEHFLITKESTFDYQTIKRADYDKKNDTFYHRTFLDTNDRRKKILLITIFFNIHSKDLLLQQRTISKKKK